MTVTVKKTVEYEYELPDDYFNNGEVDHKPYFDRDMLISFCENTDEDTEYLANVTEYVDEITFEREEGKEIITEEDYQEYCKNREDAERCYECGGYGDDYDGEGKCNCTDCPFGDSGK